MRGRAGTVLIIGVWIGSWGLLWIHGAFLILVGGAALVLGFGIAATRDMALNDSEQDISIWLPFRRVELRHNRRARLIRRWSALRTKKNRCENLIEECLEPIEQIRLPVLRAEADAAQRDASRIHDDIQRLEATWALEDRERTYRKLTA